MGFLVWEFQTFRYSFLPILAPGFPPFKVIRISKERNYNCQRSGWKCINSCEWETLLFVITFVIVTKKYYWVWRYGWSKLFIFMSYMWIMCQIILKIRVSKRLLTKIIYDWLKISKVVTRVFFVEFVHMYAQLLLCISCWNY